MALTEPFDLLGDFPGWTTDFEPLSRQEMSRTAGGRTIVKDMGLPLWTLSAQSRLLKPNALDFWRARLNAMENGMATFIGYSLSRTYPIAYPNGSWPTGGAFNGVSATLHTVDANRKAIRVGNLPAGFVLSVGDFVSIDGVDLHQVMEAAVASGAGLTPLFEVRPRIWDGVDGGGSPAPVVSVLRPACIMAIVPGSVVSAADPSSGNGKIFFKGFEAR